jgi:hypothetical protein
MKRHVNRKGVAVVHFAADDEAQEDADPRSLLEQPSLIVAG